jgi:hypothetical protein
MTALTVSCEPRTDIAEVPSALAARWSALDEDVRDHLQSFMDRRTGPEQRGQVTVAPYGDLPSTFHDDLVVERAQLRTAFPIRRRTVTSIRLGPKLHVHMTCESRHDGTWFAFMQPTHRDISFVERHTLQRTAEGDLVDVVRIDFGAIIRQLMPPAPVSS